jgi:hypothetical protein
VDKSVGIYTTMGAQRLHGFGQFYWDAERTLGSVPSETKGMAPLFCSVYSIASHYVALCNKHGMYPMDPSTLTMGLCRWIESIITEYLQHIFGKRQLRDSSRILEACKSIAAAETTINYTLLNVLKSQTYTEAAPKIMLCSMIDPIHVHELPRLFFNYIISSISLPIFYAVSIFQREMEVPAIPLDSVVELFTNGKMCLCCTKNDRLNHPERRCTLSQEHCHTVRIKKFLNKMVDLRAFLPRESNLSLSTDSNITQYITAYGGEDDRCNMQSHSFLGATRSGSCMRVKSGQSFKASLSFTANDSSHNAGDSGDGNGGSGSGGVSSSTAAASNASQTMIQQEALRLFTREAFVHYKKQLEQNAIIKEGEFLFAMQEFATMTTKFVQFFGNMEFFGKHKLVMQNLGVQHVPMHMPNLSRHQVFSEGVPLVAGRCFVSGELGVGIDWMAMLLMLGIAGSSRIDQQLAKDVSKTIVSHIFNDIPYSMYPYDHIQIKEFNPYTPRQEILPLKPAHARAGSLLRPENMCIINPTIALTDRIIAPAPAVWMECMIEVIFLFCFHYSV